MNYEKPQKKKRSVLNIILCFFILSAFASAGLVSWKNIEADNLEKEYKKAIENQERQIKEMMENDQIGAKTKAKNILTKAQDFRIEWSKISYTVLRELESEEIQFDRISAGNNKYFTISGRAKDLRSIARLIAKIRQHENFSDPFVSNLSKNGSLNLPTNFNLTFYYIES